MMKTNPKANKIIEFWRDEIGPDNWYKQSDDIDALIAERYKDLRDEAVTGALDDWMETAEGALALIILIDQFSRNLYRGDAESFAGDAHARELARVAIKRGFDTEFEPSLRQFYFMPLCHSEELSDHDELMAIAVEKGLHGNMPDFHAHREIIREFGRFPFRNAVLGREMTAKEQAFLNEGGYMKYRQAYIDAASSDS